MTTAPLTEVEIGTVFYRSWGYDQTQVNWAVVVGLTSSGKSVRLQEIGGVHAGHAAVLPDPERKPLTHRSRSYDYETGTHGQPVEIVEPVVTKRIQHSGSSVYLAENTYSDWCPWDGTPKYSTPYGFGH